MSFWDSSEFDTDEYDEPIRNTLPDISIGQQNAIDELSKNRNVIIDSVAGCGKTTTNMYICKQFESCNILLLTYNARLKLETRVKAEQCGIGNISVQSYHSFCVKNYDRECFTDSKILEILKNDTPCINDFRYDIIILDEAQDINPTLYELFCKIYRDNYINAQICVLGDQNQSIYDFNDADSRYITLADKLFNFNDLPWYMCKLPFSFRITKEMSEFINNCLLTTPRIYSEKVSSVKPSYIYCDIFKEPFGYIKKYLKDFGGDYDYDDIFILGASVKKSRSPYETPIRVIANSLSKNNIPIYVPISDDTKIDESIMKNKIVFSTFHQSKGLERKLVFIVGFDNSYFKLFNRGKTVNRLVCPNILYVATTRAQEKLVLFHHNNQHHLPFINQHNIKKYCDVYGYNRYKSTTKKELMHNPTMMPVTQLISHLPEIHLMKWVNMVTVKQRRRIKLTIETPHKVMQTYGYETVSEITGTMIPAYYEYLTTGHMTIFNKHNKSAIFKTHQTCLNYTKQPNQEDAETNREDDIANAQFLGLCDESDEEMEEEEEEKKFVIPDLKTIQLENATIPELMYITNIYDSTITKYLFKPMQLNSYNWLSKTNLNKSITRLKSLKISKCVVYEYLLKDTSKAYHNYGMLGLCGNVDCISGNKLYEFKCVEKLNNSHYLQLIIYMCMYENFMIKNNIYKPTKYFLYNIKTDEKQELICGVDTLNQIVNEVLYQKNKDHVLDEDEVFLNKQNIISKKILIENL
jgi:hypothetical protein